MDATTTTTTITPELNDFINTGCDSLFLWKCINDTAIEIAHTLPRSNYTSVDIAAYCIYKSCLEHNAPRAINEITDYFRVNKCTMLALIRLYNKDDSFVSNIKCSQIARRLCGHLLELSFKEWRVLGEMADHYQFESGCYAQTIVAATIFKQFGTYAETPHACLELKTICNACQISISSVKKALLKLEKIQPPPPPPPSLPPAAFFYGEQQ